MKKSSTLFKFSGLCAYAICQETDGSYSLDKGLLECYKRDPDYLILERKITELHRQLNIDPTPWLPRDIETEIFYMV